MERLSGYLLLMQVLIVSKGSPPVEDLIKANNQSAADLPAWFPSTRCSAGVTHTTPLVPPPMSLEEEPLPSLEDNAGVEEDDYKAANIIEETEAPHEVTTTTTERTIKPYLAPAKNNNPALYVDDE